MGENKGGGSVGLVTEEGILGWVRVHSVIQECLTEDGVISLEKYRNRVRPVLEDAGETATLIHRRAQASIHVMKRVVDQRNTDLVMSRAGIWYPRERRKKDTA